MPQQAHAFDCVLQQALQHAHKLTTNFEHFTSISATAFRIMETENKFIGLKIPQSAELQVRNTIETLHVLGNDIRDWPDLARKELLLSDSVDILNAEGDIMSSAPRLALVFVSPVFREHFCASPDATEVMVYVTDIEAPAVHHIVKWIDAITTKLDGKFGINVPQTDIDLVKVRYAAYKFGMEMYVRHFVRPYRESLRTRVPTFDECVLVAHYAVCEEDELLVAVGERIGYLRRRKRFTEGEEAELAEFLEAHEMVREAVEKADARSARARSSGF